MKKKTIFANLDDSQRLALQLIVVFIVTYVLIVCCVDILSLQHSLLSRVMYLSLIPIGVCLLSLFLNRTGNDRESRFAGRLGVSLFSGTVFLAVGCEYPHLCHAGLSWVEGGAMFFVPLMMMGLVFLFGASRPVVVLNVLLATVVYGSAAPYLAWAHGEPTRTAMFWNAVAPRSPQAFCARLRSIKNGQSLDEVTAVLGSASPLTDGEDYDFYSQLMCAQNQHYTPSDKFYQWFFHNSLNPQSPASVTMQFRDGQLINFRDPAVPVEQQKPKLRPHPKAVPNTHAPGEVDHPELVRFVIKDQTVLPGIVIDEMDAELKGKWQYSTHTPPYVGLGYLHDQKAGKGEKSVTYTPVIPVAGHYEVRISHCYNVRRSTNTPVTIHHADGEKTIRINQQETPEHGRLFRSLGKFRFQAGNQGWVRISSEGTEGKYVIADAIQFIPVKKTQADTSN